MSLAIGGQTALNVERGNVTIRAISLGVISSVLMIGFAGCGGVDDSGETTNPEGVGSEGKVSSRSEGLLWGGWFRRRPVGSTGGSSGSGGTGGSTGDAGSSTGARTGDGRAIPQGPGPNGECPDVVKQFGFWSCIQIGDQCTFQAGGVVHHCTCIRVDGEGQLPAWSCD